MKFLTIAEEELMFYIWQLGDVVIADLLSKFPEPKPNYNTISTIVKILERKGYLSHTLKGKNHLYSTLVTKEEYSQVLVSNVISNYFGNDKSKLETYLKTSYEKNSKSFKDFVDSYRQNLNVDNETQIINRDRRVRTTEETTDADGTVVVKPAVKKAVAKPKAKKDAKVGKKKKKK